jgi:hypothetical protein
VKFSIALPTHPDGEPAIRHDAMFMRGIYLQPCVTDYWIAGSIMDEDD